MPAEKSPAEQQGGGEGAESWWGDTRREREELNLEGRRDTPEGKREGVPAGPAHSTAELEKNAPSWVMATRAREVL